MTKDFKLALSGEEIASLSNVDLAYEILKSSGNTFHYRDLLMEIGKHKGLSQDKLMDIMAEIYSEINIDGRFFSLGDNVWGLKRWFPTEKPDKTDKPRKRYKRKSEDDEDYGLDGEDYLDEDEDEDFDEDYEEDYDEDDEDEDEDDRGGRDLAAEFPMEEDLEDDLDDELEDDFDDEFDSDDLDIGDELSLEQLSEEEDSETFDDEDDNY